MKKPESFPKTVVYENDFIKNQPLNSGILLLFELFFVLEHIFLPFLLFM